jgi:hypothetical protein
MPLYNHIVDIYTDLAANRNVGNELHTARIPYQYQMSLIVYPDKTIRMVFTQLSESLSYLTLIEGF